MTEAEWNLLLITAVAVNKLLVESPVTDRDLRRKLEAAMREVRNEQALANK